MSRTIVYIDGFNLYYGALKGTPYKWLDIEALARRLAPRDQLVAVRYFTARVRPQRSDPQQPQRQQAYLRALGTLPTVTIHFGHYLSHATRMPLAHPRRGEARTVEVIKTEEKGSDVNLATCLLLDAFRGRCDKAVVVTNDSDLQEPIRVAEEELGLGVVIVNPHPRLRRSLALRASAMRQLREATVAACQLPLTLTDADGPSISRLPGSCPGDTEAHPKVGLGLAAEATRGMSLVS
jgi:uncharacterized LabA/DUF88 family protein